MTHLLLDIRIAVDSGLIKRQQELNLDQALVKAALRWDAREHQGVIIRQDINIAHRVGGRTRYLDKSW